MRGRYKKDWGQLAGPGVQPHPGAPELPGPPVGVRFLAAHIICFPNRDPTYDQCWFAVSWRDGKENIFEF